MPSRTAVSQRKKSSATHPALTDADVASLRAKLSAGEKPRVIVRAASAAVPSGTRGNVIRLGNPSEGEFIVVRLGRDEVPFAPSELALTTRPKNAATASAPAPAKRSASAPKKTAARTTTTTTPAKTTATASKSTRGRARGRSGRKTPPPLTVTLRFGDGTWTVEAQRGARRLARASALRPGAVKAFADHVDEPAVREALTETVESCRAVVEERAAKLRAELSAAEAALKEYEAGRR
ncbi:MAG: hypothetical protein JO222_02115 [Frankiales bacterium]|nr:hypothetical protein [Frankiales bacterium]